MMLSTNSWYITSTWMQVRPPPPATYLFLFDVSFNAMETGCIWSFCMGVKKSHKSHNNIKTIRKKLTNTSHQPSTTTKIFIPLTSPSGYLELACEQLLENLESIPGDARKRICIMAVDSCVHFFNLSSDSTQPQVLSVPDLDGGWVGEWVWGREG